MMYRWSTTKGYTCAVLAGIVFWMGLLPAQQSGQAKREETRKAFEEEDYVKALNIYQDLARSYPDLARRVAPEFERMLFEKAFEHANSNEYEKYREALNVLRRMDPTPKEVSRLVEVAGIQNITRMSMDNALSNRDLRWLLGKLHEFRRSMLVDNDRMNALVERLVNQDISGTEREQIFKEIELTGQYAIPYLLKYIADERKKGKQTFAIQAMVRIGPRAVLPTCELLRHADDVMKIHAANILGKIRPVDERAVAMLKWTIENPKSSPNVVNYATEAFFSITGLKPEEARPAAEYFFILANRYYMDEPTVADEALSEDGMVWRLTDLPEKPSEADIRAQTLEYMKIQPYAWNEIQAEKFARYGIKSAQAGTGQDKWFYPLLACIYAAQYQEVKYLLDIIASDPRGRPLTDEELLEIKSRYVLYSSRCKFIARSMGPRFVYQAIGKAMKDKRPQVAAFLLSLLPSLDTTGEMLPPAVIKRGPDGKVIDEKPKTVRRRGKRTILVGNMPESLRYEGQTIVNALSNPDQRIRFAAAISLAEMNPPEKFVGYDKVAMILGDAISVASRPVLLLVEEDNAERNRLRAALEALGYSVTEATTGDEGVAAALQYPPKDLIVLSDKLRVKMNTRKVIDALQEDPRTRAIPYAVLGDLENFEALKEKFGPDVVFIPRRFENLGTTKGEATASTENTLTDKRATFTTTGAGLSGAVVRMIAGKGRGQARKVLKNDETTLTLEEPWQVPPQPGATYVIEAGKNQRLQYPIEKLLTNQEVPSITRLYADQVAIAAAIALADMDPERTVIRKADLYGPISRVLASPISNDLRLQLIKAAKNLRVESAVVTLSDIAKNAQHTSNIRAAALEAIAYISPDEFTELAFSLITEESEDIRRAISQIIGIGTEKKKDTVDIQRMLDLTPIHFVVAPPPVAAKKAAE